LLGKTRQSYYKQVKTSLLRTQQHAAIVADVLQVRKQQPKLGTSKLHVLLKKEWEAKGLNMGRDQLFNILRDHNLLIKRRRRIKPRTTLSQHHFKTYPDLAKELVVNGVDQLIVGDITYLPLRNGQFCYLFLLTDAYSKLIVGYKLAKGLQAYHALAVLEMAQQHRLVGSAPVHHSDRGIQYCTQAYIDRLKTYGYQVSMTQTSDPRDNSIAERVNGILKHELLYPKGIPTSYEETEIIVSSAIEVYNKSRPHMSCGMKMPIEIHEGKHQPKNLWKRVVVNQK